MKRMNHLRERDHERQWTVAGTQHTCHAHFLSTFRQFNYAANYFNFFIFYLFHLNAKIAVNNRRAVEKRNESKSARTRTNYIEREMNIQHTYDSRELNELCLHFVLFVDCLVFSRVHFVMRFALHNKTMNQNDDKESKWTSINPKMAASRKKSQTSNKTNRIVKKQIEKERDRNSEQKKTRNFNKDMKHKIIKEKKWFWRLRRERMPFDSFRVSVWSFMSIMKCRYEIQI